MRQIELDATAWRQPDDFYSALLSQLGAPKWHGRNLDALDDSIFGGSINAVEPPFHVSIIGTDKLSPPMKEFLAKVRAVFSDGEAEARISFSPPL